MNARRLHDDAGVAAVEFALLLGVLLALVALVWPLGEAFTQKLALDRAMSDVIRYATAAPNSPDYDPDQATDGGGSRRPNCNQVTNEFFRAMGMSSTDSRDGYTVTVPNCPVDLDPGQTVTVSVTKTSDLGPLGDLLSMAGITHTSSITVSAAASGREE